VAAVTVYSAPEDGRKGLPKHVEHTCSFNKHNTARVASCWFIIYYIMLLFLCELFARLHLVVGNLLLIYKLFDIVTQS